MLRSVLPSNMGGYIMGKAFFNLSGGRRMGRIVKRNDKTVWVKVMFGAKTFSVIKRHIDKHKVSYYG